MNFRVAAPSRLSKGRRCWFFLSNEFVGHETKQKSKPRPFKPQRVGHPKRLNQSLRVDILEWYHPIVQVREQKTRKGGPPANYTYDSENRIITTANTVTGVTASYVYDAGGRRIRKTTSNGGTVDFLYDSGGHEITQVTSAGSWTRGEVYAGGRHLATYSGGTSGTTAFNFSDWLGTERARSLPGATTPCETITSLPFGDGQTITGTCGDASPMHFTGKERDSESGLDNFGARYDSSQYGRFMSPDPVAGSAWNPQSLNAYSYVWNNPLNLTDPTGMIVSWEDSGKQCKDGETTCRTNLQRQYENRIQSLLDSKNNKDQARGRSLQDTYDKLQKADETFHVVREGGNGSGELAYRGHPGDLYVEMKGNGASYGQMPDLQKLGHEFEHGAQFLNGLLGFALDAKGKWVGYRDDLVDEANAFMAGFKAEQVGNDQSNFLQGLGRAANFGVQAVVDKLNTPGSPYYGRPAVQIPITTITPSIYAVPRTQ